MDYTNDMDKPSITANVAAATAVSSGVVGTINEYAGVISLGLTLSSLVLATVFYALNYRLNKRRLELREQEYIRKHKRG